VVSDLPFRRSSVPPWFKRFEIVLPESALISENLRRLFFSDFGNLLLLAKLVVTE
jgi:hypothetical protein